MFYYTRQMQTTKLSYITVAKRCSSNFGIHVSISLTPTEMRALIKYLQSDLQSLVQPLWERTGSLCDMGWLVL